MRKNGNVILRAPREELATQEKLELESQPADLRDRADARRDLPAQSTRRTEAVQKLLSTTSRRCCRRRGSAVPDARTNKLFVRDTALRLEEVRRIISQLDIPVRQVLIEARIVEADDRFSRNLGAKFGFNDIRSTVYRTTSAIDPVSGNATAVNVPVYGAGAPLLGSNTYSTLSGNLQGAADLSSQLGSNLSGINAQGLGQQTAINNTNFVNLPAGAISGANPASFALSLFGSSLTRFVNLEISALEADQRGKVVSSPRVLTADQGKAIIEQGTELPYQTATSSGATPSRSARRT
jgi:type IV pilus assembly protein PilQ